MSYPNWTFGRMMKCSSCKNILEYPSELQDDVWASWSCWTFARSECSCIDLHSGVVVCERKATDLMETSCCRCCKRFVDRYGSMFDEGGEATCSKMFYRNQVLRRDTAGCCYACSSDLPFDSSRSFWSKVRILAVASDKYLCPCPCSRRFVFEFVVGCLEFWRSLQEVTLPVLDLHQPPWNHHHFLKLRYLPSLKHLRIDLVNRRRGENLRFLFCRHPRGPRISPD